MYVQAGELKKYILQAITKRHYLQQVSRHFSNKTRKNLSIKELFSEGKIEIPEGRIEIPEGIINITHFAFARGT